MYSIIYLANQIKSSHTALIYFEWMCLLNAFFLNDRFWLTVETYLDTQSVYLKLYIALKDVKKSCVFPHQNVIYI